MWQHSARLPGNNDQQGNAFAVLCGSGAASCNNRQGFYSRKQDDGGKEESGKTIARQHVGEFLDSLAPVGSRLVSTRVLAKNGKGSNAVLQCDPLSSNGKQQSFFLRCTSKGPGQQLVALARLQTSAAAPRQGMAREGQSSKAQTPICTRRGRSFFHSSR